MPHGQPDLLAPSHAVDPNILIRCGRAPRLLVQRSSWSKLERYSATPIALQHATLNTATPQRRHRRHSTRAPPHRGAKQRATTTTTTTTTGASRTDPQPSALRDTLPGWGFCEDTQGPTVYIVPRKRLERNGAIFQYGLHNN